MRTSDLKRSESTKVFVPSLEFQIIGKRQTSNTKSDRSLDTSDTRKRADKLRTSPHCARHNDLAAEFAHAETNERGGGKCVTSEGSNEVS